MSNILDESNLDNELKDDVETILNISEIENNEGSDEYIKISKDFIHMLEQYTKDMTTSERRALNALIREENMRAITYQNEDEEHTSFKDKSNKLLNIMELIQMAKDRVKETQNKRALKNKDNQNMKFEQGMNLYQQREDDVEGFELQQLSQVSDPDTFSSIRDYKNCKECEGIYLKGTKAKHNKTEGHKKIKFFLENVERDDEGGIVWDEKVLVKGSQRDTSLLVKGSGLKSDEEKKSLSIPLVGVNIPHLLELGDFDDEELSYLEAGRHFAGHPGHTYWFDVMKGIDWDTVPEDIRLRHSIVFAFLLRYQKFSTVKNYYWAQNKLKHLLEIGAPFFG